MRIFYFLCLVASLLAISSQLNNVFQMVSNSQRYFQSERCFLNPDIMSPSMRIKVRIRDTKKGERKYHRTVYLIGVICVMFFLLTKRLISYSKCIFCIPIGKKMQCPKNAMLNSGLGIRSDRSRQRSDYERIAQKNLKSYFLVCFLYCMYVFFFYKMSNSLIPSFLTDSFPFL